MSGQEGMRGYILQSIIAVLESLDNDWDYIQIEPKTKNDKVDIIWFYENRIEICQVKSTINQFNKNNILGWIEGLYEDFDNADKYKILIIGDATHDAKKWANNPNIEKYANPHSKIENIKNKISVEIFPLNISVLSKSISSDLDKLFHSSGQNVNYPHKDLITKALIAEFSILSTNGNKLSKKDFIDKLFNWVTINFSTILESGNINLSFWFNNKINYASEINRLSITNIENFEYYKTQTGEIIKLIEQIDEIKLHQPFQERKKYSFFYQSMKTSLKLLKSTVKNS